MGSSNFSGFGNDFVVKFVDGGWKTDGNTNELIVTGRNYAGRFCPTQSAGFDRYNPLKTMLVWFRFWTEQDRNRTDSVGFHP